MDGTFIVTLAKPSNFPAVFPVRVIVFNFLKLACLIAFITLTELPLVEIPIKTSPSLPRPCICLEKIESKLDNKSFIEKAPSEIIQANFNKQKYFKKEIDSLKDLIECLSD